MTSGKMHADEVDTDVSLVRRLVAEQFPALADLPVRAVQSTGTVNAIFKLGDELYARLPRVAAWADGLETELTWLPVLAPRLPLRIPEPLARGAPARDFPFAWAIYHWIDGHPYDDKLIHDERQAATDLAQFVLALRRLEPRAAPTTGRRPLAELDAMTRAAIAAARDIIDADAAISAWERALEAPPWDDAPVWSHTDLLRPNLLVNHGRLHAVIDFGGVGIGDPAFDIIPAWSVFGAAGRTVYRAALAVDDGVWNRARGYALHQAALIIPYYAATNPGFVATAKRTVAEVLADFFDH